METIKIEKKEYDFLVKCRHIVESEFSENYSKEFINDVKESEEDYKKGDFIRFKNVREAKEFFDKNV